MFHRIVIVLVLISGACKKDNSATGAPAQEAMGLYAKGFNDLIADPKQMITEYFDNIPESGPEPGSKPRLFPRQNFGISKIKEAREAFKAAKEAAPASLAGLAAPADDALVAIDKVATTFAEAHKYYDAENYKDDQFAKGKVLHAQMLEAAKQFRVAINKLEDGLSVIEDQQAVAEVAKYASDKGYSYWFRFYNMEAKKFIAAVEHADTPEQRAALATAFQPIATANDDLTKFVASKGTKVNGSFNAYVSQASSFHATAVKLLRLVKDPAAEAELGRETEALIRNYNNMVSMANSLYQVEGADALN
jgi:hypothetical protein